VYPLVEIHGTSVPLNTHTCTVLVDTRDSTIRSTRDLVNLLYVVH